jgi:Sulfatase-modifying factor enzyme 1/TIR domain
MAPGIFVSYRRDDTQDAAGRLYDRLVRAFPRGDVFMDVDRIRATQKFPLVFAEKIANSGVMLVVIGKQWLTLTDASRRRRIDNPKDFVRLEVSQAIGRGIPLVPVLVNGATLPREEELPEALRPLVTEGWQAVQIRHDRFGSDVDKLIDDIRHALPPRWVVPGWVRRAAASLVGVAVLAAAAPLLAHALRSGSESSVSGLSAEPLGSAPVVVASPPPAPEPAVAASAPPRAEPMPSGTACVTDSVLGCLRPIAGRGFLLMESEVTEAMWQAVMGDNPSTHAGCPKCPVESVSWDEAVAFAKKMSENTGYTYRLPTSAEWEYAARGNEDFKYSGSHSVKAVAWYDGNSGGATHPVCEKLRNAFGLCDMSGNVWEWTADLDLSDPTRSMRVIRGGSSDFTAASAAVANHFWGNPSMGYSYLGLRLARSE